MKTLPFHCKTVSTINLEALVKLARGIPQGQRLSQLLKFVDDPTSYTPMSDSEIENAPVTKLSQEDVILYQKAGQIRKISRDQVKATVRQFAVTEERLQKNYGPEVFTNGEQLSQIPNSIKRRRGISWPKQQNENMDYECQNSFSSTVQQITEVKPGDFAICADLSMSFSQIPLSEEVQMYHCFRDAKGQWWAMKVLVMGSKPAELMHVVTEVLALARQSKDSVRTKVHGDNVRFLDPNKRLLNEHYCQLKENCALVGAQLSQEETNQPHECGISFGVAHNYQKAEVALSEKTLRKLVSASKEVSKTMTLKRAFEIMGLVFYGSRVLNLLLAKYYFCIKWYRKLANKFEHGMSLETLVNVWPSQVKNFEEWISTLLKNQPVTHYKRKSDVHLFTDASKWGWGSFLIDKQGEIIEFGKRWTPELLGKDTFFLEAQAIVYAIEKFRPSLEGNSVMLHIDNTSVLGGLENKHSQSHALNTQIQKILTSFNGSTTFQFQFVGSKENLADASSRGASARSRDGWLVGQVLSPTLATKEGKITLC
jgi:hypothetical protein